ncbi:diol dehydratase reactivase subunit alpha [Muricomes intestini]|uniref:Diol dehydratase reactivase alpha subunit n=1 Tax=Muricomes intestini TaxID=1796634 RepID=A0A4R3K836_9FIRM|nr:diol dehydratase reactivase subunit alpha [Muricomes intestini]TCS78801.1 diol dehydratase reactivase alpha subunit [Muricomes intestini]HAX50746.1 diol dehydratase reactivase subunit alpha [Lachnospiraceae bacterium]HCR83656.1 diol dehydratase reactivase subunit alpha [Lachnospiraceae bacterium]
MTYIAGVDIGNSTTEVCVGEADLNGSIHFLTSSSCPTTGTKGTLSNTHGIKTALKQAMSKINRNMEDITLIRLNEAAPVIGDTAMETLTETIITDSSMIGHNPSTPAGAGQAVGEILLIDNLSRGVSGTAYIVAAPSSFSYEEVAALLNQSADSLDITGVILQADEAVLVENRLHKKVPIIDEVARINKLPDGVPAAIEVALPGQTIRMLSNPYGIATLLHLNAEETRTVTPIAKSLIGKRSAVVLKTPGGNVRENALPAGEIYLEAENSTSINLDEGAEKIMQVVSDAGNIRDLSGQPDTNVGNMFNRIKKGMSEVDNIPDADIHITDILAVDTMAPVLISGALAGETCLEKAVGIAAMVKTQQLPMQKIAEILKSELHTDVKVAGVEAVMAGLGALTTPGTKLPLAILDMGGGSTDAAVISEEGRVIMTHQAGAGELVSMLIETELGLSDRHMAEQIKKYPLAKVESLFHMRMENGQMTFVDESIDPRFYGRVVLLAEEGFIRIEEDIPMEKIVQVRQDAKRKVFVTNAFRALQKVAPDHDLKNISNVVLVGGSAEDFEIPEMLMDEFSNYRIVCGRGNIRGQEGPRNAVATGLVLSYAGEIQ